MENKETNIVVESETLANNGADSKTTLKKKKVWPIILIVLLILCGVSYYVYSEYLNKSEPTIETTQDETKTETKKEETTKDTTVLLNGTWSSDDESFETEFTINSPTVETTNGIKGTIQVSDKAKYQYMIVFPAKENNIDMDLVFYIDSYQNDKARFWIPENDGTYVDNVIISKNTDQTNTNEAVNTNANTNNTTSSSTNTSTQTNTKPNTNTSGSSTNTNSGSSNSNSGNTGSTQPKGHWETRTEVIPAWDEQVLVKAGWSEQVLVREAWVEEDTYCAAYGQDKVEVLVCNTCGGHFGSDIYDHISSAHGGGGGWHNDYVLVGEPHCLEYKTEYINHPAEYNYIWHEPEYKTVHHPEETRTYQVWVND